MLPRPGSAPGFPVGLRCFARALEGRLETTPESKTMPELLHLPPVAQAVLTITGVVLAVVRLLTASKSFWWYLPAWVQKGAPALLVALGTLPKALEAAQSWLDVTVAFTFAVGAWFTASRGDQAPVQLPRRKAPPLPLLVLCLALLLLLLLPGCSNWKPVARTADGVAETLCAQFFGEKQSLSLEDAARQFCATHKDLKPWIDATLAAKREAAPKALALHP